MHKFLIICGPTATGKTALAAALAKKFNGELISADSRQVYKGMDIGTGKDRPDVPVWLYDVVWPNEEFSVSHWIELAKQAIDDINGRNKLPIVVGGTGLYIDALIQPLETIHIPPNPKLREQLKTTTVPELQAMIDPTVLAAMNQSDRKNPRRLIRKIEIASYTGDALADDFTNDTLCIGLTAPTQQLYERIDARVDARVDQGVIQEIVSLCAQGYGWDLPAMSGLGYKEWRVYMEAPIEEKEALKEQIVTQWKFDEHAYARRQMTWFKKQENVVWFDVQSPTFLPEIISCVQAWYTKEDAKED